MRVATMIANDNIVAWLAENVAAFSYPDLTFAQASKPLFIIKACFLLLTGFFSVNFLSRHSGFLSRNSSLDFRGVFVSTLHNI